jgi:hypothetical protein
VDINGTLETPTSFIWAYLGDNFFCLALGEEILRLAMAETLHVLESALRAMLHYPS